MIKRQKEAIDMEILWTWDLISEGQFSNFFKSPVERLMVYLKVIRRYFYLIYTFVTDFVGDLVFHKELFKYKS